MLPPSCLKDTLHSLVKKCSMVTRDRKEPPSENSRDLFFFSVTQLCLPLCDPMDCNTPGFPILHHLLELTQIHVHWVGDAIQLSRPLLSPSPPAFNLSQHQGLFQWASCSHQVAKGSECGLCRMPLQSQPEIPALRQRARLVVVIVQSLSCLTLRPHSMPGSSVFHYLLELAKIRLHWVNDTI